MAARLRKTLIFADCDNGGIIHVANIKGGVGKSTVATNLASAFAKKGPTLLIDLDVQGSATVALGIDPASVKKSSWNLFRHRFSTCKDSRAGFQWKLANVFSEFIHTIESLIFSQFVGRGEITSLTVKIHDGLDLVPANSDLFKPVFFFNLQNFLYNLELCRSYYTYIILDTPSVWNNLTKVLYVRSNLNLIPVTLNALAAKSLKDYFVNVRKMARKNPAVRVRIIKNEVFGKEDSKIKGKTRTMNENRRYLDSLCEQVAVKTPAGHSIIPQSVLFDLEIPESAIIRDAQDDGKPLHLFSQYNVATRAFDELARRVQYVLNSPPPRLKKPIFQTVQEIPVFIPRIAAMLLFVIILGLNLPSSNPLPPRPVAPQQLILQPPEKLISHTFGNGESIYKFAKYVICRYRAMVPSPETVYDYALEVVAIYNRTRLPGELRIANMDNLPNNITITFYPPASIVNPKEKELLPVYDFFCTMVDDSCPYVTGDWCERGFGGGTPHYGIDVAAKLGSQIITPIDGIVVTKNSNAAGHSLGVVKEGMIITFAHMDKRFYTDGQYVKRGMAVGTVGLTGQTTGPHVHVGYGIKSLSGDGVDFGRGFYKFTDPKLFFYRERYLANVGS